MISKYRLYKYVGEYKINRIADIKSISCFWDLCDDPDPVLIREYASREEGLAALKKYENDVRDFRSPGGLYIDITTYALAEEIYDEAEDGEFDEDMITGDNIDPLEIPNGFELLGYRYDSSNPYYPEWVEIEDDEEEEEE